MVSTNQYHNRSRNLDIILGFARIELMITVRWLDKTGVLRILAFYKIFARNHGMVKVRARMWLWQIQYGYGGVRQLVVKARERSQVWLIKKPMSSAVLWQDVNSSLLHERCQKSSTSCPAHACTVMWERQNFQRQLNYYMARQLQAANTLNGDWRKSFGHK